MSLPFRELTVRISRSRKTNNLMAHVLQESAEGPKNGKNILARRNVRRIETAKIRVQTLMIKACDNFHFDVQATPDLVRPKKIRQLAPVTEDKLPFEL